MDWITLAMIIVYTLIVFLILGELANKINEQQEQIDKLHLECENYLQLLAKENIIPEIIVEGKIKQMNKKYGEVKLIIK